MSTLATDFAQLVDALPAAIGLAFRAVGSAQTPTLWGDWHQGPAWSTVKVPVVIAGYRQQQRVSDLMKAAIIESDNAAAQSIWEQLGDPTTAGQRVRQVLAEAGDPTIVETRKLRPEFTAFGQTIWSLTNQVSFLASACCNSDNDPIFDLMGQVVADQRWGIGRIPHTKFKGGWGPSRSGNHLVRQMGVLSAPAAALAVAMAAEPESGSFADGTKILDEVATWLSTHLGALCTRPA